MVDRLRAAGCVFAEDEAALLLAAAGDDRDLERLVRLRVEGRPLEHLLGWVDFAGIRLRIDTGVFVPRQRTAALAERAAALVLGLLSRSSSPVAVDLCCGCGAIAAVVADRAPAARVHAADLDTAAVANARHNLEPRGVGVHAGDLFDALPRALFGRVDVLTVNAPYVPTSAIASMPPEARDHESRLALDGGIDGLDVHRRVLAGARSWLAHGGHVLIECSTAQSSEARALVSAAGLEARVEHDADRDATLVLGRHSRPDPWVAVSHI